MTHVGQPNTRFGKIVPVRFALKSFNFEGLQTSIP